MFILFYRFVSFEIVVAVVSNKHLDTEKSCPPNAHRDTMDLRAKQQPLTMDTLADIKRQRILLLQSRYATGMESENRDPQQIETFERQKAKALSEKPHGSKVTAARRGALIKQQDTSSLKESRRQSDEDNAVIQKLREYINHMGKTPSKSTNAAPRIGSPVLGSSLPEEPYAVKSVKIQQLPAGASAAATADENVERICRSIDSTSPLTDRIEKPTAATTAVTSSQQSRRSFSTSLSMAPAATTATATATAHAAYSCPSEDEDESDVTYPLHELMITALHSNAVECHIDGWRPCRGYDHQSGAADCSYVEFIITVKVSNATREGLATFLFFNDLFMIINQVDGEKLGGKWRKGAEMMILRRYSDFLSLRSEMLREHTVGMPAWFPEKHVFGKAIGRLFGFVHSMMMVS